MKSGGSLSIWFFIGISLAVNGAVILGTGIYELVSPPVNQVVLYNLHANIWWGAVLLILGLFFSLRFSPAKERARVAANS
jgi:FtsH-binding integral membrane protein